MYRYVRKIPSSKGHKYGDVLKDGDLKARTIEILLAKGTLVRVTTPPLTEIPNFEGRARQLVAAGITTIEDLAEADAKKTAKVIHKSPSTIRRWQSEAMEWLAPNDSDLDSK